MDTKTYMRPGVGRARRRKLGLLQKDVAARLGVAVPTFCNWEVGRNPVPWHHAAALACALGGRRGLFVTAPAQSCRSVQ